MYVLLCLVCVLFAPVVQHPGLPPREVAGPDHHVGRAGGEALPGGLQEKQGGQRVLLFA
jgi:hypothetical protein